MAQFKVTATPQRIVYVFIRNLPFNIVVFGALIHLYLISCQCLPCQHREVFCVLAAEIVSHAPAVRAGTIPSHEVEDLAHDVRHRMAFCIFHYNIPALRFRRGDWYARRENTVWGRKGTRAHAPPGSRLHDLRRRFGMPITYHDTHAPTQNDSGISIIFQPRRRRQPPYTHDATCLAARGRDSRPAVYASGDLPQKTPRLSGAGRLHRIAAHRA